MLVFVVFVINYGIIVYYGCSENTLNKIIKKDEHKLFFSVYGNLGNTNTMFLYFQLQHPKGLQDLLS